MNMEFVSKYKWWILGGTLGLVATRLFTPQQTATNEATTSQAYDPALVSLGIQAGIEQDRMKLENAALVLESDTTRYIAGLAADTEVKLNASDNAATLEQLETGGKYDLESMKLENQGLQMQLDQQERLAGGELALRNTELSVEQHLGELAIASANYEIGQQYNLANYQTMVQHDLGKKGIAAQKFAGLTNSITSGLAALFGKG